MCIPKYVADIVGFVGFYTAGFVLGIVMECMHKRIKRLFEKRNNTK